MLMSVLTLISGLFGALGMLLGVPEPVLVMLYIVATFAWFYITGERKRALGSLRWLQRRISASPAVQQPSPN